MKKICSSGATIPFALNHMAAPTLGYEALIALAVRLGCVGVEFRNDLPGVELFGGAPAKHVKAAAEQHGIRIIALSEIKRFNDWSATRRDQAKRLIETAVDCGAEAVALIPVNAPEFRPGPREGERVLRKALEELAPEIEASGLVGFVEPLGFEHASLRTKRAAVDAIADIGGSRMYRVVHDTFHHHLAGESEMFPAMTGIVHISGVNDPELDKTEMRDGDRVLVDSEDRLGSVKQMKALAAGGFDGCFSYEPFAKSVHQFSDPEPALRHSMDFIRKCFAKELT